MSTALGRARGAGARRRRARRGRLGPGSAIYEGWVSHRRTEPVEHGFRYRIFMPLVDLDELPGAASTRSRSGRPGAALPPATAAPTTCAATATSAAARRRRPRPRRRAHRLPARRPGADARQPPLLGRRLQPGLLLLRLRRRRRARGDDRRGHQHALGRAPLLRPRAPAPTGSAASSPSASTSRPFMPMEQTYEWSASEPGERLVGLDRQPRRARRAPSSPPASRSSAARCHRAAMREILFRYPPMTATTIARIYLNAARLKLKGAPYFTPPSDRG